MNTFEGVKRGDIYVYDFDREGENTEYGKRPVIVIQDHRSCPKSPTAVVAAISSAAKKMHLPGHIWLGANYGLRLDSIVMLEQVRTVNKSDLGPYIGTVTDADTLKKIATGIKKMFGLWSYSRENQENIRCLCPRCAADYRETEEYVVRRVDPYDDTKGTCDKCDRPGYDYFVYKKTAADRRELNNEKQI